MSEVTFKKSGMTQRWIGRVGRVDKLFSLKTKCASENTKKENFFKKNLCRPLNNQRQTLCIPKVI